MEVSHLQQLLLRSFLCNHLWPWTKTARTLPIIRVKAGTASVIKPTHPSLGPDGSLCLLRCLPEGEHDAGWSPLQPPAHPGLLQRQPEQLLPLQSGGHALRLLHHQGTADTLLTPKWHTSLNNVTPYLKKTMLVIQHTAAAERMVQFQFWNKVMRFYILDDLILIWSWILQTKFCEIGGKILIKIWDKRLGWLDTCVVKLLQSGRSPGQISKTGVTVSVLQPLHPWRNTSQDIMTRWNQSIL